MFNNINSNYFWWLFFLPLKKNPRFFLSRRSIPANCCAFDIITHFFCRFFMLPLCHLHPKRALWMGVGWLLGRRFMRICGAIVYWYWMLLLLYTCCLFFILIHPSGVSHPFWWWMEYINVMLLQTCVVNFCWYRN
jgi:hypothetical protein